MFSGFMARFKANPTNYYALSICATWAGIGSLMNGVTMTQTYGVIPSLIWGTYPAACGFGTPGKLSSGQFSVKNGRQPRTMKAGEVPVSKALSAAAAA